MQKRNASFNSQPFWTHSYLFKIECYILSIHWTLWAGIKMESIWFFYWWLFKHIKSSHNDILLMLAMITNGLLAFVYLLLIWLILRLLKFHHTGEWAKRLMFGSKSMFSTWKHQTKKWPEAHIFISRKSILSSTKQRSLPILLWIYRLW